MTSPYREQIINDLRVKTTRARARAIQLLQAAHPDDWQRLHGDARQAEGLPRQLSNTPYQRLQARIAELEAELSRRQGD